MIEKIIEIVMDEVLSHAYLKYNESMDEYEEHLIVRVEDVEDAIRVALDKITSGLVL